MSKQKFEHPGAAHYDRFANQRQIINDEINGQRKGHNYVPKIERRSFEIFKKDAAERHQLKEAKRKHKAELLKHGFDPKKVMNVPFGK